MALFKEAVLGKRFECDECKKTFNGEDIKLKEGPKNMSMASLMTRFLFVDKNGYITGGSRGPDGTIGDQVTCCPLCGYVHLFGFNRVAK